MIHFLNRETQLTKAVAYPITRIELAQMNDAGDNLETVRVFVVDENGKWQELN
jgi:hypothetical protein